MGEYIEDAPTHEYKRASLLGLPVEIRMSIYNELFRIRTWEAHQARNKDLTTHKRRLSDQCPVCQSFLKDGDYLYPTCRLVCKTGELVLAPPCYTPSSLDERTNRAAILRVCRTTNGEAVNYVYANTQFMVYLGTYHPGLSRTTDGQRMQELHRLGPKWKSLLARVGNLRMRVDIKGRNDLGALKIQIAEVMNSVWRDREYAKVHLQVQNRGDGVVESISLTTKDDSSSHPRFRLVLYGISYLVSRDEWYLFLLKHILPVHLLLLVEKFAQSENDLERNGGLDKFLLAVNRVQRSRSANDEDFHGVLESNQAAPFA